MTEKQKLTLEAFDRLQDIILMWEDENEDMEYTADRLMEIRMDIIRARSRMAKLFQLEIVKLP